MHMLVGGEKYYNGPENKIVIIRPYVTEDKQFKHVEILGEIVSGIRNYSFSENYSSASFEFKTYKDLHTQPLTEEYKTVINAHYKQLHEQIITYFNTLDGEIPKDSLPDNVYFINRKNEIELPKKIVENKVFIGKSMGKPYYFLLYRDPENKLSPPQSIVWSTFKSQYHFLKTTKEIHDLERNTINVDSLISAIQEISDADDDNGSVNTDVAPVDAQELEYLDADNGSIKSYTPPQVSAVGGIKGVIKGITNAFGITEEPPPPVEVIYDNKIGDSKHHPLIEKKWKKKIPENIKLLVHASDDLRLLLGNFNKNTIKNFIQDNAADQQINIRYQCGNEDSGTVLKGDNRRDDVDYIFKFNGDGTILQTVTKILDPTKTK